MSASDLLGQLRRLLGMEQAARALPPAPLGASLIGGDTAGLRALPPADPAQVDAMVLDLLAGADDAEVLAALRGAGPADASQEAAWLAEEAARRGIAPQR